MGALQTCDRTRALTLPIGVESTAEMMSVRELDCRRLRAEVSLRVMGLWH